MSLKKKLGVALAILGMLGGIAPAFGQTSDGVLRLSRGTASRDVAVSINRAVVLEATQPFTEVSVANPGIADVAALSNASIYILGKKAGRTTLTLLGEGGKLIANVTIRVEPDLSEFKARLAEILPDEEIDIRTANDGIVLSGVVSGAAQVARAMELAERYAPGRVSNMMSVGGTQQVQVNVRFAEVQRSAAKQLGINWNFGYTGDNGFIGAQTGNFAGFDPSEGVEVSTNNILGGFTSGGFFANIMIEALESKGFARTLAQPNLVALSGDTATFLAGGEYPIPVQTDDGISVEYKQFGISLAFTPTIINGELINLEVEAQSSNIDNSITVSNGLFAYSGFSTRRARTTVEMRDGESFSIAGLMQDDFRDNGSQVPWLGDVPVLGALFRSTDYQRRQTELVVVVTANLVAPTTEDALSLPTDRFAIPSEKELFLEGNVVGSGVYDDVAGQNFDGSFGYVME